MLIVKAKDRVDKRGRPRPAGDFLHKAVMAPLGWEWVSLKCSCLNISLSSYCARYLYTMLLVGFSLGFRVIFIT